jgi:pSer/pThr/pTyr-binding forkhead associated (FHA) protein
MTPELIPTYMSGPDDGRVIRLIPQVAPLEVTFGRLATCTVSLPDDPEVSKRHCKGYWGDGVWWLEDLRSTNGTFVGEFAQSQQITGPVRLSPGQIFRVGCTRFRLEATDKPMDANVEQAQALMSEPFAD